MDNEHDSQTQEELQLAHQNNVIIKSASEMPKKFNALLQDLSELYVAEVKKNEQLTTELKSANDKIKNLETTNNDITNLNMELEKKVISYVKQLTDEENNMILIKPHEKGVPPVGYEQDNKIHLGKNVFIEKEQYNNCISAENNYQLFVKRIAVEVFGERVLINSNFTRFDSRGSKNDPDSPGLDSMKLLAICSALRYYMSSKNENVVMINLECLNIGHYIIRKIYELCNKL